MAFCVINMSIQSKFHSYGMFVTNQELCHKTCVLFDIEHVYLYIEIRYDGEVILSTQ